MHITDLPLAKAFPHTLLIHTEFVPKILIFMIIYTDFVSEHSGMSYIIQ